MPNATSLSIIILAAGKGTRMKSRSAKVLHQVFHKPMVHHVIQAAQALSPQRIVVIVGHDRLAVEHALLPWLTAHPNHLQYNTLLCILTNRKGSAVQKYRG